MSDIDEFKNQSDHDLLIRLYERVTVMMGMVTEMSNEMKKKVDLEDFNRYTGKVSETLGNHEKRIGDIERGNLVDDTKKNVYIGMANLTFKHWSQILTGLGVASLIVKAIFSINI